MSARRAALQVLDATLSGQATLDRAFERAVGGYRLLGPDRAFARALAAVTLRRLGEIDARLKPILKRPLPRKALTAQNILRLGAAQLLFLKTPAHAAVGETTALATGHSATYRGLTNAVLRRLSESASDEPASDQSDASDAPTAARLNTPGWLWESWRAAYGAEAAAAIAQAHMAEPPLDFTILSGDTATWAERLEGAVLPTGGIRRQGSARITDLPGYAEGAWAPQDAAAALPARLFGDVRGKHLIDLCAAPGGKSAQLAAAGARVTAVDHSAARMIRVTENMARLRLTVNAVIADGRTWRPDQPADAVLLDAPCSATGTIRRHPDVPWCKSAGSVRALLPIQASLLAAAAEMTRPGGTLLYVCCSLQPEEGPAQIKAFLANRSDFARAPISGAEIPGLPPEAITPAGDLRTFPSMWPDLGGMDGFYTARLVRRA